MNIERYSKASIRSLRPLVRYVDEEQAIIDAHLFVTPPSARSPRGSRPMELLFQLRYRSNAASAVAFHHRATMAPQQRHRVVRFGVPTPHRWWPAGMGDQTLYDFEVTLLIEDQVIDNVQTTLGMTSVRPTHHADDCTDGAWSLLLVNGRERSIHHIVPVDPDAENQVLPATGDSLLLVRDHFGPDVLYDAADQAGILLVQALAMPDGDDEQVTSHVDRLARHPSLVGWVIDSHDAAAESFIEKLRGLDPTRSVFRRIPA